jgi:carnitine monooxygenase subunit
LRHPLPRSWYTSPDHFAREMCEVFGRAWLPVCHGSDIAGPGSYLTLTAGGEEIFLVHDRSGEIRGFHNACQHRAHRLLDGAGTLKAAITCPYHAWAYGLDGSLRAAPRMGAIKGFNPAQYPLRPVRTASFAGFVMICHDDDAPEASAGLRDIEKHLLVDHPDLPQLHAIRRRDAVMGANWKTIIENYLECYHCDVAHPSFGEFDLSTWKHIAGPAWSRQGRVPAARHNQAASHGTIEGLSAWWQWPNIFWARAFDEKSFVVAYHEPLAANATRQVRVVYALDDEEDDTALRDFNELFDEVFQEDVSVVESVQRGLSSRGYRGGALIEDDDASAGWSEHVVGDFQTMVRSALEGTAS